MPERPPDSTLDGWRPSRWALGYFVLSILLVPFVGRGAGRGT